MKLLRYCDIVRRAAADDLDPVNSEQNLLLEVVRVRVRQRGRLDALLREARLDLRDVDLRAVIDRCVLSLSLSRVDGVLMYPRGRGRRLRPR